MCYIILWNICNILGSFSFLKSLRPLLQDERYEKIKNFKIMNFSQSREFKFFKNVCDNLALTNSNICK